MISGDPGTFVNPERLRYLSFEGKPRAQAPVRQPVMAEEPVKPFTPLDIPADEPFELPADTDCFIRTVLEQAGLAHQQYRTRPLVRRVSACMRALDAHSLPVATALVQKDISWQRIAADTLLIGVTGFFRDRPIFDVLASQVIPVLVRRRGVLDVWSVGCSDGAELYSVAMILAEQKRWCIGRLLGTDCRQSAVDRAVTARYPKASAREVPELLTTRYLRPAGNTVTVIDELRRMARWRTQNALATNDYACWDLILCRNMAIYLDPGAVKDLWQRLARALRPGGVLVVGRAERPHLPELQRIDACIYLKKGQEA